MSSHTVIPFPLPCGCESKNAGGQRVVHGRVAGQDQEAFLIRLEDGRVDRAYRACGCLMLPEPGDVVLVYAGPGKAVYILSVLEKANPEATLAFDDAVRIQARRVEMEGAESMSLSAPDVEFRGARGTVGFLGFSLTAGDMSAKIGKLTSFVEQARSSVRSLIQTVRDSLRRVESMETVEAARMRTTVEKSWTLKTGSAALRADQDVDIDGEHINLG
ncbi:MAG: DUF3540 domain-containing protein [Desulfovibrionaceae bacterium]